MTGGRSAAPSTDVVQQSGEYGDEEPAGEQRPLGVMGGASAAQIADHEGEERPDRWPVGPEQAELAERWGIDPERDLRKADPVRT